MFHNLLPVANVRTLQAKPGSRLIPSHSLLGLLWEKSKQFWALKRPQSVPIARLGRWQAAAQLAVGVVDRVIPSA